MEMSANTFLLIQDQWGATLLSGWLHQCVSMCRVFVFSCQWSLGGDQSLNRAARLHLWHAGIHLCTCTRLLWHACLFLLNETLKKACRKMGLCWLSRDRRWSHASLSSLIFPNLSKTTLIFTFPYKWMFFHLHLDNMQLMLTALF